MKELVIISGKGGTGKTSITASFAVMAKEAVLADCDVDAADLHLILAPHIRKKFSFFSGHMAQIRQNSCTGCGFCFAYCRFEAILVQSGASGESSFFVDPVSCEGCGVCVRFCPAQSIDFPERLCGEWMISDTRCGPMVHARLGIAADNSGKLVTTVRRAACDLAQKEHRSLILVDGPPGIGCPAIASVTGASLVLVVTEPTLSGEHDLERVLALTRHFQIPTAVCINKWDLNPEVADRIERKAGLAGVQCAGRIRYDHHFTTAQVKRLAVAETSAPCLEDIRTIWNRLGF